MLHLDTMPPISLEKSVNSFACSALSYVPQKGDHRVACWHFAHHIEVKSSYSTTSTKYTQIILHHFPACSVKNVQSGRNMFPQRNAQQNAKQKVNVRSGKKVKRSSPGGHLLKN